MPNEAEPKEMSYEEYMEAEKARIEAQRRPSKLHEMPIVAYVESEDGKLLPVYRYRD